MALRLKTLDVVASAYQFANKFLSLWVELITKQENQKVLKNYNDHDNNTNKKLPSWGNLPWIFDQEKVE